MAQKFYIEETDEELEFPDDMTAEEIDDYLINEYVPPTVEEPAAETKATPEKKKTEAPPAALTETIMPPKEQPWDAYREKHNEGGSTMGVFHGGSPLLSEQQTKDTVKGLVEQTWDDLSALPSWIKTKLSPNAPLTPGELYNPKPNTVEARENAKRQHEFYKEQQSKEYKEGQVLGHGAALVLDPLNYVVEVFTVIKNIPKAAKALVAIANRIKATGTKVTTKVELVTELGAYATANGADATQAESFAVKVADHIIEGENITAAEVGSRLDDLGGKQAAQAAEHSEATTALEARVGAAESLGAKEPEIVAAAETVEDLVKGETWSPTLLTPEQYIKGAADDLNELVRAVDIPDPAVVVRGVGNILRMGVSDDIILVHAQVAESEGVKALYHKMAGAGAEGTESFAATEEGASAILKTLSDEMGVSFESAIAHAQETHGAVETLAKKMLAGRQVLNGLAGQMDGLYKRLLDPDATDLDFTRYIKVRSMFVDMKAYVESTKSHVARATTSGRIEAGGGDMTFSGLTDAEFATSLEARAGAKSKIADLGGREEILRIAKAFAEAKTLKAKVVVVKENHKLLDSLISIRTSGMLTGPPTAARNILGNIARPFMESGLDYAAWLAGKFQKEGDVMSWAEATAGTRAMASSVVDGFFFAQKGAGKLLSTELADLAKITKEDFAKLLPSNIENAIKHTGVSREYVDVTKVGADEATSNIFSTIFQETLAANRVAGYGVMKLGDAPFEKLWYETTLKKQIARTVGEAHKAGKVVDGDKLYDNVKAFRAMINKGLAEGNTKLKMGKMSKEELELLNDLDTHAMNGALEGTWKGGSKTTNNIARFFNNDDAMMKMIRLTLVPFVKTPLELTAYAVRSSPLAPLTTRWRDAYMMRNGNGQVEKTRAVAQWVLGSATTAGVIGLVRSGYVTGTFNQYERAAMRSMDLQENSFYIDGKHYDVNRLDPVASLIFSVASASYAFERGSARGDTFGESATEAVLAVGQAMLNKTFLTALGDIMRVLQSQADPDTKRKNMDTLLANQVSSAVPFSGLIKWANREEEEHYQYTKGAWDKVKTDFGLGDDMPFLDVFGRPMVRESILAGTISSMTVDRTPAEDWMIQLKVFPKPISEELLGVKLTKEEHYKYLKLVDTQGKLMERLNATVKSDIFVNAQADATRSTDDIRATLLKTTINTAHSIAKAAYIADSPWYGAQAATTAVAKVDRMKQPSIGAPNGNQFDMLTGATALETPNAKPLDIQKLMAPK